MKKQGKRLIGVTLAGVTLAGMLMTGCAQKQEAKQEGDGTYKKPVNICMSSWIGYGPMYVAKEKGIFEKHGVNVNIQVIESVSDINSSLASGNSDGSVVAPGTMLISAAAGIKQKQVMVLDDSYGGDGIVSVNGISSFKDLKGKKVGVSDDGDTSTLLFYYLLKKNGMSKSDMTLTNLSPADAGAAFVSGKVDAAVTYEPWLTKAKEKGKVLISSQETPGLITDVLCLKNDFIAKYPKTVQAMVDSWYEALDYVKANPAESDKIMAESQGMTVEDFEAALPSVRFFDKAKNKDYFSSKQINDVTKSLGEIWTSLGLIDKTDMNYDSTIDGSFVG